MSFFTLKQLLQDLKKLNNSICSNSFGVKLTKDRTRRRRQDNPQRIQPVNACGICRDEIYAFEYNRGDGLYTPCHHLFHKNCIKSHLLNFNNNCPLCRENI